MWRYSTLTPEQKREKKVAKFWLSVDRRGPQECWEWKRTPNGAGYGEFCHAGAHCFSFALHFGPIPRGLCVLHKCDNPKCVNPNHLFLGTHKENAVDKVAKGRDNPPRGEKHVCHKLTDALVIAMRISYRERRATIRQLAKTRKIAVRTAVKAVRGLSWKHLPGAVAISERAR